MNFKPRLILFCTAAAFAAASLSAQTIIPVPSAGNTGAAPNGIAVTPSQLLLAQPYCAGMQTRGVYSVNIASPVTNSTSTLVNTIPEEGICSENYITISTGNGGFTAGDNYATGVSPTSTSDEAVYKNGVLFISGLPASRHHAGVTFDATGTFGYELIVTLEGSIRGYDATGTLQFTYTLPTSGPVYVLEGATVAPLTYAACPGCLYVTGELSSNVNNPTPTGPGEIFYVTPNTPSGSPLVPLTQTPGPEPEGLVFVGNNLACSLNGYAYFVSGYATGSGIDNPNSTTGAVLAYTPADLAPFAGQFLVPTEGFIGNPGAISAYSPSTNSFSTFSSTQYQLEGSTILSCLGNGCPATFGFWKHHAFPASMFVNGVTTIGCQTYTPAQLLAILKQNNAGGNAVTILGHQLIAAIANFDAGASQNTAANDAIAAAIDLLCANNINLATSSVPSGTPLGAQMVALANTLDTYNSSAPTCEGNGLTTGAN